MSTVRFLRGQASAAKKRARGACSTATKTARARAKARLKRIELSEYKRARAVCEQYEREAAAAERDYVKARPPVTAAQSKARAKSKERREFTRRDAVNRVLDRFEHIPRGVAELAVKRAEKRGNLPRGERRWEALADRVSGADIERAWAAFEAQSERESDRAFKRRRGASIQPVPADDEVIIVEAPF